MFSLRWVSCFPFICIIPTCAGFCYSPYGSSETVAIANCDLLKRRGNKANIVCTVMFKREVRRKGGMQNYAFLCICFTMNMRITTIRGRIP